MSLERALKLAVKAYAMTQLDKIGHPVCWHNVPSGRFDKIGEIPQSCGKPARWTNNNQDQRCDEHKASAADAYEDDRWSEWKKWQDIITECES